MTRKKYFYPVLLTGLFISFLILTIPDGALYGSYTDWLSQHVRLAETIRSECIARHTLTPAFLPLGGGSNGYQVSYYGYLRPDILIGCLLPQVPMVYLIIGYMLTGYLLSVLLCYRWLLTGLSDTAGDKDSHTDRASDCFIAFTGSVLFMTAACFFQTHRQIMFVNYMPFLMLALLAVKKRRIRFLPVILFFIYVNSFYYSIACLAVIGWYWLRQEGREFWKNGFVQYLKSVLLSVGMAALLLLPTASVILEHHRASQALGPAEMFGPAENLSGLLYSPYGMGLTVICLYFLLLGLSRKKYRADSLFLLIISTWCFAAWVLNGTLYTRTKILIPFVPLVILQSTKILRELLAEHPADTISSQQVLPHRTLFFCPAKATATLHWKLWPCLLILLAAPTWISTRYSIWIAMDAGIILFVVLLQKIWNRQNQRPFWNTVSCLLLCIMPCLIFLQTTQKDNFVKKGAAVSSDVIEKGAARTKLSPLYRYDTLIDVLNTCNLAKTTGEQKSSMYSSITNNDYASVYYDTFLSPVQINNSVAILPSANPFLLTFLGVRFLQTTADHIPCGYQPVDKGNGKSGDKGDIVLAENRNVLPLAYVTNTVMGESQFLRLDDYGRLDAITRYTIVLDQTDGVSPVESASEMQEVSGVPSVEFASEMQDYTPGFQNVNLPDTIQVSKTSEGYLLNVKKKTSVTLNLEQTLKKKILLLEFDVSNCTPKAVVIDINGTRNKLSGASAPYPNENHTFHYQFSDSSGNGLSALKITFSKGSYLIRHADWHLYDELRLSGKQYTSVEAQETKKDEVLSCTTDMKEDGYFVTSIPLQKGIEIRVDGKNVPILKVNQAFAGARLEKGKHDIRIIFHAPGQRAGYWISIVSLLIFLASAIRQKQT